MAENRDGLEGATWRQAVTRGTAILYESVGGQDTTDAGDTFTDARRLLQIAVGAAPLDLIKDPDRRLTAAQARAYRGLLRRRAAGEPVSRITGTRGFYGREFVITPATLDPRPESETLIDTALELLRTAYPNGAGLDILDIGTGSGCLLLTLLAEWPGASGIGIDPSPEALKTAGTNAQLLGVAKRCTWVRGTGFANLDRRFPLIISNPPYIPTATIATLSRDVRDFDPVLALDGGPDGLDIYRAIAADLAKYAAPGWVLFEAGDGQAADIVAIVAATLPPSRMGICRTVLDLAGKKRCVSIEIQE